MGAYLPGITQAVPNTPELTIPATVDKYSKPRLSPKLRSGYFFSQDRRYFLYSRKASCHLEDLTWYEIELTDKVVPGSETVWVRGIDVTGTDQYKFRGQILQINGGALTHPGTRWGEELKTDIPAYISRCMLVPGDEIRIEYDYMDWSTGLAAAGAAVLQSPGIEGLVITPLRTGAWANSWTVVIPAATGNPAALTVDVTTQTITLTDWNAGSTTMDDVITATDNNGYFLFELDGQGGGGTDLLDTLITALGGAPQTETFAGGTNDANTLTNITEIHNIEDSDIVYKLEELPRDGAPVIITDDRMRHWDGRNISPEFTISEEGYVEFNVPRNYVYNPDFWGDSFTPILWATTGTVAIETPVNYSDLYPRSGANLLQMDDTATVSQTLPAFDQEACVLSIAIASDTDPDVVIEFFDNTWTSLGSDSFTPQVGADWTIVNITFGPAGQNRTFDFNTPADATHMVVTITANDDTYVDYMFWGRTTVPPDHWTPSGCMTVEFEVGEKEYYEHQPVVSFDPDGEPIENKYPLDSVNVHSAFNTETSGFLYFKEEQESKDFRLGLGGTETEELNTPVGTPLAWRVQTGTSTACAHGDAGDIFLAIGSELWYIMSDGQVRPLLSANNIIFALHYSDGILYIGGNYTTIGGVSRTRLAAYDMNLLELTDWDPSSTTAVNHISEGTSNSVLLAFDTTSTIGGASRDAFAELDKTTGLATAFDPTNISGGSGVCIEYDPVYGGIYGAGTFTTTVGDDYFRMFDGTGTMDATFQTAANDFVNDILIDPYNRMLYIAGDFTNIYATAQTGFAKIDTSTAAGTLDAWDPTVNADGASVDTYNGEIYLGGSFTTVGGESRPYLARVDDTVGTVDTWRPEPASAIAEICISDNVLTAIGPNPGLFIRLLNGEEARGRRHLPYAKVDSLGKLRHVSALRYNAWPWVREVTDGLIPPSVGEIRLVHVDGIVQGDIGVSLTADPIAGDTELAVTATSVDYLFTAKDSFAIIADTNNREVIKATSFTNGNPVVLLTPVVNTYSGATFDLTYTTIRGFVDQKRYIYLKVVDTLGAPMENQVVTWSFPIGYTNVGGDVTINITDISGPTNQDGEWVGLIEFLDETTPAPGLITFTVVDKTFTIPFSIAALP